MMTAYLVDELSKVYKKYEKTKSSTKETKSSTAQEQTIDDPALKNNCYYQSILEIRRDRRKLGYALPDDNQRQLIFVVFALKTGVPAAKIKKALVDPESPVMQWAETYIEFTRSEKLKLCLKIKEMGKPKNDDEIINLISDFIRQLGTFSELKNALGPWYQKNLVEKGIQQAKKFAEDAREKSPHKANDLHFIIKEFQSTFAQELSLESKDQIVNIRKAQAAILEDLKKAYDQTNAIYNEEIEAELKVRLLAAVNQISESVPYNNLNKAHEKYRVQYKENVTHMIKTLKEIRKTYPKETKETLLTPDFLFKYLPVGTAFGWMEKVYQAKKVTVNETKPALNLLDMKQIEQDLDTWLKASHK